MKTLVDFDIWIGKRSTAAPAGTPFEVRVWSSPAGPAYGTLELDLEDAGFKQRRERAESASKDLDGRREFGQELFKALFKSEVLTVWNKSQDANARRGLRVRLWIDDPGVSLLPWELLWDPAQPAPIATRSAGVLSRYLPVPEPASMPPQPKLRVLLAVAEPPPGSELQEIPEAEIKKIEDAIGSVPSIELKVLRKTQLAGLQAELQRFDPQVVHWLGHGNSRWLSLPTVLGTIKRVQDLAFVQLFNGRPGIRLVVLNACQGSQAPDAVFAGVGPALVQQGVPAVIAMQYDFVLTTTARTFSQAFYGALANSVPVDVAVNEARQLLAANLLEHRDWSTPVLYLGTRSGRICQLEPSDSGGRARDWQRLHALASEDVEGQVAAANFLQSFAELAQGHQRHHGLERASAAIADLTQACKSCEDFLTPGKNVGAVGPVWRALRDGALRRLSEFSASNPTLLLAADLAPLLTARDALDAALNPPVLAAIKRCIGDFGAAVHSLALAVARNAVDAKEQIVKGSAQALAQLGLPTD